MSKLQNFKGYYCESEFESAFLSLLEQEGWHYLPGNSISRNSKRDVLYLDDLEQFLCSTNPELIPDEIRQIMDTIRLVGSESDFTTLHKVYNWMVYGIQFTPQNGLARMVNLIDFENPENNIFRAVNQFSVEYINNGKKETRRPDIILYVNGLPLCVMELKNPADANATILDAWEQITIRYWRDIPHLLHYCPLACISDGVKTRLGTVRTPYEHFYAWRRVNAGDKVSTLPFDELQTMIKGVYNPDRFLEIFRDYIYFQDSEYDHEEREIVCRYPQFFATRLLKQSVVKSVVEKSGKGGTYFGATGCGKTYTMAFLARQLALRCTDIPEIGSPTIIMIVDRDDLQKQGAKLFTKSKEFLNLGEVTVVPTRKKLREELGARESGGFYICTIQKFCDREDDKIGLINSRSNIICFSDEAHRTQLEHAKQIQFSKDADENMRAMVSKPYAKVLKEAKGKRVWLYNSNGVNNFKLPASDLRSFFFLADRCGIEGFLSSEINVVSKTGCKNGIYYNHYPQHCLFYVSNDGKEVFDSWRLVLLRQGFNDYDYLALYKKLLKKKGKSVPGWLVEAEPSFDPKGMPDFRIDTMAELDKLKDRIAREIEKLQH